MRPWEILRNYQVGIIDPGEGEDFCNWVFENVCKPDCGVECNDRYIEGPEFKNMIGCFLLKYTEEQALSIFSWLLDHPAEEYKKGIPIILERKEN